MSKCPSCGADVAEGMKFCCECGARIPQDKECPQCHARCSIDTKFCSSCGYNFAKPNGSVAASIGGIGDKNVIAGDVNLNHVSTTTNYITKDESHQMVKCHVCERPLVITDAYTCAECHQYVCQEHYDNTSHRCLSCQTRKVQEAEANYRRELEIVLADGIIDRNEFEQLERLRKMLGLSAERAMELQNKMKAEMAARRSATGGEAPLRVVERAQCDRARDLLFQNGKYEEAFRLIESIYMRHPMNEEVLSVYLVALAQFSPDRAKAVISALKVDLAVSYLVLFDLEMKNNDLASAEEILTKAEGLWPDNPLLKCRHALLMYATARLTEDRTYLAEAMDIISSFPKTMDKLEKSWQTYVKLLVSGALGDDVPDITERYCKSQDVFYALMNGTIIGIQIEQVSRPPDHEQDSLEEAGDSDEEGSESEEASDENVDDEEGEASSSSGGHYSVVLKVAAEDQGPMLRDLVEITGKRLWPDISDMVSNLPAVVAEGLSHDEADKYALALLLDGAEAEVVADGDDNSEDEDSTPSEPYPEMIEIPGRNFKLGCTPVTQAQWKAVMGDNPSYFSYKGANRPVEKMTWDDCQEFIEKLNEETGMNFRLPTQEEWEFACRAGSDGDYGLVDGGEEGEMDDIGWYDGNSNDETHPVAQKQPNAWGLYDMHGNVSTWCADGDDDSHVICGGAFNFPADMCTATYRNGCSGRDNWIGLRLALSTESNANTIEGPAKKPTEEVAYQICPSQTGLYSVVVKNWGPGRTTPCDGLRIEFNCNLLKGMGFDEFNGLLKTPVPFTLVKRISREQAESFAAVLQHYDCDFEVVAVEPLPEGAIDFDGIVEYIKEFKKTVRCDDIVMSESSSFEKKWNNISGVISDSYDDVSLERDAAIAILDCTVFGSAKNGALIDKSGIYTNNDSDLGGWINWDEFKTSGCIKKTGSYDVHIFNDPDIGVNVSGCSLSADNTMKLFKGLLALVRGE